MVVPFSVFHDVVFLLVIRITVVVSVYYGPSSKNYCKCKLTDPTIHILSLPRISHHRVMYFM